MQELDGCSVDMASNPTPDADIDGWVLFADCKTDAEIEQRKAEWAELFGV